MEQTEATHQNLLTVGQDSPCRTPDMGQVVVNGGGPLRLLVVEHDELDFMALQRHLGAGLQAPMQVGQASSLAEALAVLDQECPDVVLTELDLPDSRGLETVRKLTAHATHPVCIVVTDFASPQMASDAIALGVQDYLRKVDLSSRSVAHAIRNAVSRRWAEKERTRLLRDLGLRVRELNCLYGMSQLIEASGTSQDMVFEGVVHLTSLASQCSETVSTRIVFEDREFRAGSLKDTQWQHSAGIKVHGKEVGRVEVGYPEQGPQSHGDPCEKETRALLEAVAERLGKFAERQQAQEALRIASQDWAATFNAITDLISVHDRDLRLTRVNKAFADAFGMKPEDMVGRPCYEIVHGMTVPCDDCPCKRVMETGQPYAAELFVSCLGLTMHVSASPIRDESGDLVGFVHLAKFDQSRIPV